MGKSDKKIKSERINSLRKKYDAFLEEDKKRKERNEYILEKLDKMRYCNAVVPVRQRATTVLTETKTSLLNNVPRPSVESSVSLPYNDQRFSEPKSPRTNVDATILQEISKKYILIPKLQPTSDDYVTDVKPKIEDNTDWKSKYQILEQLKRDEKEQDITTHQEIFQAGQDQPNITHEKSTTKDEDALLKYQSEIPDHILSDSKLFYNLQSSPNNNEGIEQRYYDNNMVNEIPEKDIDEIENYKNIDLTDKLAQNVNSSFENYEAIEENDVYNQTELHHETELIGKNNVKYEYYKENVDESKTSPESDTTTKIGGDISKQLYIKPVTPQNNIETEYISPKSDSKEQPNVNYSIQENETNQETYLDKEEVTLVHDINASDVINVINNDIAPDTNTEFPVETIDIQDFTPHEGVQLQDGVNLNPEPQNLAGQDDLSHHYDPIVDAENLTDPTKPYDAEQSQEFYDEQANQNYNYTEEGLQDNYNTEYTVPNENYEQSDYAYYEGAQTEQDYQEVADNEETSQRYDQNYEQQYGATNGQESYDQGYTQQGFEKPEYAEQIQHYENTEQAQQELETVQYETQDALAPQYVEQQLDNEQGYAENENENIEMNNVENSGGLMENVTSGDQLVTAQ